MSDKTQKTIRIKWVRSGIGFTYRQKTIVRSLGLKRLNQTVVRPDTAQIRGIVAAVPHLLEIVPETPIPAWASVAEYTVSAPPAPEPESPATAAPESAGDADSTETAASAEASSTVEGEAGTAAPARE